MIKKMQLPCVLIEGVPGENTVGWVGLFAMNTLSANGDLYKCVKAESGVYTWVEMVASGGIDTQSLPTETWTFTLSDGSTVSKKSRGAAMMDFIGIASAQIPEGSAIRMTDASGQIPRTRLPAEYQEVEYIQSDDGQWIDTEFAVSQEVPINGLKAVTKIVILGISGSYGSSPVVNNGEPDI